MPRLNGLETASLMRVQFPQLPMIFYTLHRECLDDLTGTAEVVVEKTEALSELKSQVAQALSIQCTMPSPQRAIDSTSRPKRSNHMHFSTAKTGRCLAILVVLVTIGLTSPAQAQFRDNGTPGLGAGLHVGGLLGKTDLSDKPHVQVCNYLSHGLTSALSAEVGAGYASPRGGDYRTHGGWWTFG